MICAVCEQRADNPCVAFRDWRGGYPSVPVYTEVVAIHPGCDDGRWYVTSAVWNSTDDVDRLAAHLSAKRWFGWATGERLRHFAQRVTEERIQSHADSLGGEELADARNITAATRARVMERDGFKCRRCGCGPATRRLVVDHIYPVATGGGAGTDNLQTLCVLCNAGKRDRSPSPHDVRSFGRITGYSGRPA